ncbi:MAG: hypothetical protein EU536_01450 [Promethearchaeota archaeon]|nr:MAG: hypothetical protein EU536_01450 [Candidatus Lokiarchaeota archaeon]
MVNSQLIIDFEKQLDNLNEEITNRLNRLISLTQELEQQVSPKSIILPKIEKVFEEITKENIWDIGIYNEIVNDFKVRIEIDLVDKIEQELFGIRDRFTQNKRVPMTLQEELIAIQGFLTKLKGSFHQNFAQQISTSMELIDQLKSKNDTLLTDLDTKTREITELEARNTKLQAKQEEMSQQVEDLLARESKEGSYRIELETRNSELRQELDDARRNKKEAEVAIEKLESQNSELLKSVEQESAQIQRLKLDISELDTQKNELSETIAIQSQKITNLEKNKQDLEEKVRLLAEESKNQTESYEKLEKHYKDLEISNQNLITELETKSTALTTATTNITALEAEKTDLNQALETTKENLEALQTLKLDLEQKTTDLEKEMTEKDTSITDLKTEVDNLSNQLLTNAATIKELEQSKIELKEKLEIEAAKNLEEQVAKLKHELTEVTQFLEKSPKYQILYLINNLEQTTIPKLKELTNFDEGILNLSLAELQQKDLIMMESINGAITIKIKQKLNPISYLQLPSVFDSDLVKKLTPDLTASEFEAAFQEVLSQIETFKEDYPEEAGYLTSVLYLHIQVSKKYQFYERIQPIINTLRDKSFYIRLIENLINQNPWETKKAAEVDAILEIPKLNICNKSFNILKESDPEFPRKGPFIIHKFKPISLLGWDDEVLVEQSPLSHFETIQDLASWVYLNGKGTAFSVELQDHDENKLELVISAAPKTEAHLFVKTEEIEVD